MVVQRNVPSGVVSSGDSSKIGRQLGLPMATALIVGNMIGAGIFLLPVALAPFGRSAIYGWLLTIVGVLCLSGVVMFQSTNRRARLTRASCRTSSPNRSSSRSSLR